MSDLNGPVTTSVSQVTTVRFEFADDDWCGCAVDEGSGQFSVTSMDFHYGYRWNIGSNLGGDPPYSLLKGLDGFPESYIAEKLSGGSHHALTYDAELTEINVRKVVEEARERLPDAEGKEKELGILADLGSTDFTTQDSFLYTAPKWLEEPWTLIEVSATRRTRLLYDRYIPAFKAWAKQQVELAAILRKNKSEIVKILKVNDPLLEKMLDDAGFPVVEPK